MTTDLDAANLPREPEGAPGRPGDGPLAHRDFRWLLVGRAVDSLGNAMYPIGLGFAMLRLFDSVAALGLVVGSGSLGMVLFLLAGGVLADRLPRRTVLVTSNLVAAGAQAGIVAMVLADLASLPALVVLSFVTGAAAAFDGPASMALTPQTLPADLLHRGNAMLSVWRRAGNIGGAVGAGFVTAAAGPSAALLVNAVTFAAAGLCFARVGVRAAPIREQATGILADLREGWDEFVARTWVWVVVAAFFVFNGAWMGGFHLLGLVIAERTFGPEGWGVVLGAEGVGAILGGLLANRWEPSRPMVVGMLGVTTSVLPMGVLAAWPAIVPLVVTSIVAGVGIMVFGVAWETALQRHVPPERLARVFSWDSVGSFAAIPIGSFLAGPLAEALGVRTVVWGATGLALTACLGALASREVRDLR